MDIDAGKIVGHGVVPGDARQRPDRDRRQVHASPTATARGSPRSGLGHVTFVPARMVNANGTVLARRRSRRDDQRGRIVVIRSSADAVVLGNQAVNDQNNRMRRQIRHDTDNQQLASLWNRNGRVAASLLVAGGLATTVGVTGASAAVHSHAPRASSSRPSRPPRSAPILVRRPTRSTP